MSCLGHSVFNMSIAYSLFVYPIYVPAISMVVCNPLFFIPSLYFNYALFVRYHAFFFSRSYVVNMFLKPNGKQIIVETLEGVSKIINTKDIFKPEEISNRWQHRLEFYHGANNYLFIRGNSYAYDSHILSAILTNNFLDVRTVGYDYDVTKEFTWDFKDLVEIKT